MTNKLKFKKTSLSLVWPLIIILGVLHIDQGSKIYIKLNYPLTLYGDQAILDWGFFKLLLVENKGIVISTKTDPILLLEAKLEGKNVTCQNQLIQQLKTVVGEKFSD